MQVGGSAGNVRAMVTDLLEGVTTLDANVMQVAKWVKDTRKDRVKEEKKPETWASRRLWEATFPGHVIAKYETDEELEFRKTLTAKDANAWLDEVVQPANGVLIVAGNLDPAQTEADVRELFSSWAAPKGVASGQTPGVAPAPDPTERKFYVYPKEGTTQAQLTMMCQLPVPTCENRSARLVLSSAYTEVLYRELRETLGSTYGAYSYQGEQRGGIAYLAADTQIQDKTVSDGIGVMLDTLADIRGQGIDPDMLQTFKWDLARGVTVSYQTTGQVLAGLGGYANRGCALESTQQIGEQIASVSNASVQELLDRCVGHEVITIVGSKDDMLREVQEAGYEAEVVDWEQWVESDEKKDKAK
jgi:predicted Zn-dependent peptidase